MRRQPLRTALALCAVAHALIAPLPPPRCARPLNAVQVEIETSDVSEWYILQCYVGQEILCSQMVGESLEKHAHAQSRVDEVLVPTEKVASTRGRKVYHKDRIVYPGYIFIKARLDQESWGVLTRVPKVANFVGDDKGMRNGIGDVIPGYKGAVTPTPLTEREVQGMLKVWTEGQTPKGSLVEDFALGDVVAITDGPNQGERGLVRSVKNDQLVVRLSGGGGAASFDVPLEPEQVRQLTPDELAAMEQAEEMAKARADAAAREAAKREKFAAEDADYSSADAGLSARRGRRDARRAQRDDLPDEDAGAANAAKRSRWDTMAAAADRERALLEEGGGAAVDADIDFETYVSERDDGGASLGQASEEDAAFFDTLFSALDVDETPPAPAAAAPPKRSDRNAEDDALLRELLSTGASATDGLEGDAAAFDDDLTLGGDDDDESFAAFLGGDDDLDDLFADDAAAGRPSRAEAEDDVFGGGADVFGGDDVDDAELLAILGLGPDVDDGLGPEPAGGATGGGAASAVPHAAPAAPAVPIAEASDYAKRTVADLKGLLKERGLKVSGTKPQLVERLRAADSGAA